MRSDTEGKTIGADSGRLLVLLSLFVVLALPSLASVAAAAAAGSAPRITRMGCALYVTQKIAVPVQGSADLISVSHCAPTNVKLTIQLFRNGRLIATKTVTAPSLAKPLKASVKAKCVAGDKYQTSASATSDQGSVGSRKSLVAKATSC